MAINPIARGRHAARLRERPAGATKGHPPGARLPPSPSGPCSRLIAPLYGQGNG